MVGLWLVGGLVLPPPLVGQVRSVRDSSGIKITQNRRPDAYGRGIWARLAPQPTYEIGVVDGDAPYMFWEIADALGLPGDQIAVVDAGSREIRVFDSGGDHLLTLGGQGQGPGEFSGIPVVRFLPPDTLLALDPNLGRLTWFTLDGRTVRDHSLLGTQGGSPFPMRASRWEIHPTGTLVGQLGQPGPQRDGVVESSMSIKIISVPANRMRWIHDLPGQPDVLVGKTGVGAVLHPTIGAGNWALRANPPSIVVADDPGGRWTLSVYDLEGQLVGSIRASIARAPVTDSIEEATRNWLLSFGGGMASLGGGFSKGRADHARPGQSPRNWESVGRRDRSVVGKTMEPTVGENWSGHLRRNRPSGSMVGIGGGKAGSWSRPVCRSGLYPV